MTCRPQHWCEGPQESRDPTRNLRLPPVEWRPRGFLPRSNRVVNCPAFRRRQPPAYILVARASDRPPSRCAQSRPPALTPAKWRERRGKISSLPRARRSKRRGS